MSKRFSEQFKQEAVQLVSAERPIRQVASYLGIGYSTLDKWVRAHRERTGQLVALTQEQKRIRELERQVAHLQEVNDILKKRPCTLPTRQIGEVHVYASEPGVLQLACVVHRLAGQSQWLLRMV